MNRVFIFLVFISACCILNFSCYTPGNIQNQNLSFLYRKDKQHFNTQFHVWNFSADSSQLYIRLDPKDFLYKRGGDFFTAEILISYRLVESYENPVVIDSSSKKFVLQKKENPLPISVSLDFRSNRPAEMLLECKVTDAHKNVADIFYVNVDRSTEQSRNYFNIFSDNEEMPVFSYDISATDSFRIIYKDTSAQKLFVQYYHRDFPLAAPPFSFDFHESFDYKPDSVFTIETGNEKIFSFTAEGFYHLQKDTNIKSGLTLYRFYPNFPDLTAPEQLLEPIRYLTTRREFDEMKANKDAKSVVDKFWLDAGGNAERTRYLIKKYYSRVRFANENFTSYQEGWKTDRGIIYIIFGPPHMVYRTSKTEVWIYGEASAALSLNFSFIRVINPFSDNDYMLSRAPIYEANWYRAVDMWRQGRVYNDF
jgi:GWxTD domain-containing protein